jgi:HKD family nuclease
MPPVENGVSFIGQPLSSTKRLGDLLVANFKSHRWKEFRAAVAFARFSGVRHISEALHEFSAHGFSKLSIGLDLGGTSMEALDELLASLGDDGEIWVFHNKGAVTFHPKVYLFKNDDSALLFTGSGNLTEGGLYTNYEATVVLELDLHDAGDKRILKEVESSLEKWSSGSTGLAFRLDSSFLQTLVITGDVIPEAKLRKAKKVQAAIQAATLDKGEPKRKASPFKSAPVPKAPSAGKTFTTPSLISLSEEILDDVEIDIATEEVNAKKPTGFLMTLQKTDVGVGQTHVGKARRSPEIFIPLAARDYAPAFWGWPDQFRKDSSRAGKFDRTAVKIRIGTEFIKVNMMTWPVKHDFRLRSEALRSAGNVGDILRLEKSRPGDVVDYYAEVIPQGRVDFAAYKKKCNSLVRNSQKRWGYY